MKASEIILIFEQMLAEHWRYIAGKSEKNAVDCSGAFVYAYEKFGRSIYHGSNRIARTEIKEMLPIQEWRPGMAAFKRRNPSHELYALPDAYKPGGEHYNGDESDYYHIGLVNYEGKVLNAQSAATGFVASKLDSSWCGVGFLSQIEYDDATKTAKETAVIKTPDGNPVKLRSTPSTKKEYIGKIKAGNMVEIISEATNDVGEKWSKVIAEGKTGYIMSKFLQNASEAMQEEKGETAFEKEVLEKLNYICNLLRGGNAVG